MGEHDNTDTDCYLCPTPTRSHAVTGATSHGPRLLTDWSLEPTTGFRASPWKLERPLNFIMVLIPTLHYVCQGIKSNRFLRIRRPRDTPFVIATTVLRSIPFPGRPQTGNIENLIKNP